MSQLRHSDVIVTFFDFFFMFADNNFLLWVKDTQKIPYQQNFGGQNCRKSDLLPKVLSAEEFGTQKFCPPKYFVC